MPGTSKVQRCQRCRRRKIKCDQTWPTCTACTHADVACSGPPLGSHKFIVYSRHCAQNHSLKPVGSLPAYATVPTSREDMIALRLLECLQDRESSGFYIFGDHYNVIPKRLYRSVALQDAIYLLHSTWTAYRQQQLRKTNALDLKTHCQALRSIQLAINDDQQRLAPETVAAVTILHQVEVFFNRSPAYNAATHSHGLYALLKRKGPPCIDDELDTSVTLETVAIIMSLGMHDPIENFQETPTWRAALRKVVNEASTGISDHRLAALHIDVCITWLPTLLCDIRQLYENYTPHAALEIRQRTLGIYNEFHSEAGAVFRRVQDAGHIIVDRNDDTPSGKRYVFTTLGAGKCMQTYKQVSIILNRILMRLGNLLNDPVDHLEEENTTMATELCMCLPHIKERGRVAGGMAYGPLSVAYGSATAEEKTAILDFVCSTRVFADETGGDEEKLRDALRVFVTDFGASMSGQRGVDHRIYK